MKVFTYKSDDPKSVEDARKAFKELKPGTEYIVSVKVNRAIRSVDANKYYRYVLKIIATHTGDTTDRLHMLFKSMFNFEEYILPNGDIRRIPNTSKDLDSLEFHKYTNQVKQWGREYFGLDFPDRKDKDYKKWMDIDNAYDAIQG